MRRHPSLSCPPARPACAFTGRRVEHGRKRQSRHRRRRYPRKHAPCSGDRRCRQGSRGSAVRSNSRGCRELHSWLRGHGELSPVGVKGTGSYGAGLAHYLSAQGDGHNGVCPAEGKTRDPFEPPADRGVRGGACRPDPARRSRAGHGGRAPQPLAAGIGRRTVRCTWL